jgi:hypothetical protein
MPDLYPLTIKPVYDDGTAVEDALVQIISTNTSATQRWNTSGKTNAQGQAVMQTYGEYPGAPAGNYKVVVNKSEDIYDDDRKQVKESFSYVEKKYTSIQSTNLTLEVKPEAQTIELKVGKAVREAVAGPPS